MGHTFEHAVSVQATDDSWGGRIDTSPVGLGPQTHEISEQITIYEESPQVTNVANSHSMLKPILLINICRVDRELECNLPSCTAVTISCGVTMPEWARYLNGG